MAEAEREREREGEGRQGGRGGEREERKVGRTERKLEKKDRGEKGKTFFYENRMRVYTIYIHDCTSCIYIQDSMRFPAVRKE